MRVRLLLIIAVLLVAIVTMFLLLLATDTALSVWQRLQQAPLWILVSYTFVLIIISASTLFFSWRWLKPDQKKQKSKKQKLDDASLQEDLLKSAQSGVDVGPAVNEIREQQRRKQSGEVFIALFGEISTGKSSLVKALLPQADVKSDAKGGTTTEITHYKWLAESGDMVVIADLPGFNLGNNPEILEEARRAHLIVFLCDTDITRSQMAQLKGLIDRGKPLVVALNKSDQFSVSEANAIADNIAQHTGIKRNDIAFIQTGGREEIIRLLHDGGEEAFERDRVSDIEPLRQILQRHIDGNAELMEQLRDTAILLLAAEKLEQARDAHREQQATELVQTYSKRAIVGALAAVAPGSDLIIQGLLATRLIQALCKLYDVSVKDVEIESFLRLAGGKVRKMTALTLAITGNALKAFPGVGTLTGGLIHAVAYGMIFDSLGRAAAETLASRGELRPYPAAAAFEELLNDNLEAGAIRFAKIAMVEKAGKSRP
jgi:GTP-binding protein EngB required for normal cell division